MPAAADDDLRLRVAIVGLGPKGLFALERLLDHAHRAGPRTRLEVDLFEPHPAPGAGPVYDPGQPGYLRMNFAADDVDMWWPEPRRCRADERRSLRRVARAARDGDPEEPTRREPQVGRYLADGLGRPVRRRARARRRSRVAATSAHELAAARFAWTIATADDVGDTATTRC